MPNIYLPTIVKITKIEEHSPTVKLFRLEKKKGEFAKNANGLVFVPGQFVLVGKIGYGEAPFGPCSSPYEDKYIEIAVRKTGAVTNHLHSLKEKEEIALRGPYGKGFPLDFIEGKDLVAVTGGCGIPPIASLMEYIIKNNIKNKEKFGRIYLLYGARSPEEILMKNKIEEWKKEGINIILTIDKPAPGWNGHIGFVTDLVKEIKIDEANACATMCGPGPMMDALEKVLRPLGISDRRIFVSMERKMQCGIGKCQHCTTGDKYVCLDGPVFYYDQIDKNWD
ncbi:MAG: FAD/NAD(P)-binding protein [Patescibacteria group bacterium]